MQLRSERGLSREALAQQVQRSKGWLYLVETGESDPGYSDLVRLAEALRIDPMKVLVGNPDTPVSSQPRAIDGADGAMLDEVERSRREFERFLAFGFGGAVFGHVDFERIASVLAGTRTDASTLDNLETVTSDLVRREASVAPHSLLPAVRGHLQELTNVVVMAPPGLRARAYSLAGQTALLAGYLRFKQERHADAETYWSLADHFGDMAGDIRLRAALLVLQARRWQDRDLPRTLMLYDQAGAVLGPKADPSMVALILSGRASCRAEASRADASVALRDLDTADSHANRSDRPDSALFIWQSLTGTVLEYRAKTLLHLDRAHYAAAHFERTLTSIDPSWLTSRSYALSGLAAARAKSGDPEHATVLLANALDLAVDASSFRNIERVRSYRQRWMSGYDGPAVRRLDEQLLTIAPPPERVPIGIPLLPPNLNS